MHQVRMDKPCPFFHTGTETGNDHQFTTACQFQKTILVVFNNLGSFAVNLIHGQNVHRVSFQCNMGNMPLEAGMKGAKRRHILHAAVIKKNHLIGMQCQRSHDIFQNVFVIIFNECSCHGYPPSFFIPQLPILLQTLLPVRAFLLSYYDRKQHQSSVCSQRRVPCR